MTRPRTDAEATSTDLVLRCYAPQVVARAFARTTSGIGDSREMLGWRLGFVDVAQRYLLAVLAAQHAGLGLTPGAEFRRWISKLETPSLGNVSATVEELANALAVAVDLPVAVRETVALFVATASDGTMSRTAFARHFHSLIDLRNKLFHRDGAPLPDEATAQRHLADTEDFVREICRTLRVLRSHSVLYVDGKEDRQDGTLVLRALRFNGQSPEPVELTFEDANVRLPTRVPVLLHRSGDALALSPFLVVTHNGDSGVLESRLLYGWDAQECGFSYSAVDGGARSVVSSMFKNREDLLQLPPRAMLWRGAMSASRAESISGRSDDSNLPAIPGFRIEGKLGTGASSTVYAARQLLTGRAPGPRVAIKILHPAVTSDPVQRARLKHEHRILSELQHPAIVRVLGYLEEQGPSLVLEYVDGEDLQSIVERNTLPVERAVEVIEQVLSALAAAHARGVVHRDIKPSNVLVDKTGSVRLIDFGIAAADDLPKHTRTLDAVGTLGFAAPEQILRSEDVGPAADIYAVGRLLEFLLTGQLQSLDQTPSLPPGLQAIIRKATQREVLWRFISATEMLGALAERKDGGWGGAPVQTGDRLNSSYELHEPAGAVADIFAFRGAEIASDALVSIALASRLPASQQRLRTAIVDCSATQRRRLGHPRLLQTQDGILFAVFDSNDPAAVLAELVKSEAHAAQQSLLPVLQHETQAFAPRPGESAWVNALRENLQAIGAKPIDSRESLGFVFRNVVELLELVLLVSLVQRCAIDNAPPSAWVIAPPSLGPLLAEPRIRAVLNRAPRTLAADLQATVAVRNRFAHSIGEVDITSADVLNGIVNIGRLLDVVGEQASSLTKEQLDPVITRLIDGPWTLLVRRGTKARYVDLTWTAHTFDLTPEAISWLAKADAPVGTGAVQAERRERMLSIQAEVRSQLSSKPYCAIIQHQAQARHGGRDRSVDFLVRAQDAGALLVVQCELDPDAPMVRVRTLDHVWLTTLAFKAPYAAITNGKVWRWFRSTATDGLVQLSDDVELTTLTTTRAVDGQDFDPYDPKESLRIIETLVKAFSMQQDQFKQLHHLPQTATISGHMRYCRMTRRFEGVGNATTALRLSACLSALQTGAPWMDAIATARAAFPV